MELKERIQRFADANEQALKYYKEGTREYLVMTCRIAYCRNLLTIISCPPTPIDEILHVRHEFDKMILVKDYVSSHQFLVDDFDKGNELIF